MRLVIDTNVLVSALLHPGRTPDLALARVFSGGVTVLCDERIEHEYRDVLARPKFGSIPLERRASLLERVARCTERIVAAPLHRELVDPDDRMFLEVGLAGRADAIVTGNGKHFPRDIGVDIVDPAELLARLTLSG